MGVEGTVGLLKRQGRAFSKHSTLKSSTPTYLVIDATKCMDKFLLSRIKKRVPRFSELGYSMVDVRAFFINFIGCCVSNNIQPLFVFNGGRKSEEQFGPRVSCADHFRYSCGAALRYIGRAHPNREFELPELCLNVLKEAICEMGLEKNMYQATYEVYPTLVHLAQKYHCPVMTGHSDFIFHPAPAGFYWFDDVELSQDSQQPMTGLLYEHARLLERYHLNQMHSSTLRAFSTLLRPDFHEHYYEPLNGLFRLVGDLRMTAIKRDSKQTRRLTHIMNSLSGNPNLNSYETVHGFLRQVSNAPVGLMRDFENIHETYATHFDDFATTEFGQLFNRGPRRPISPRSPVSPGPNTQASRVQPAELERALTRRQSTAEFIYNLGNTTFFKTRVEDVTVARSTFSLQDAGRQFLLDNAMPPTYNELRLYDRRLTSMQERSIRRRAAESERLSGQRLLKMLHTSNEELDLVANKLSAMLHIDAENAAEVAYFLLLARFALRLLTRRDYNNDPLPSDKSAKSPRSTNSGSLGSKTNEVSSMRRLRHYDNLKADFYTALLNSIVYHLRERQGDQSSQSIPADIRVAREKLKNDIVNIRDPSILPENNFPQYIKLKHMIEALNSVLHIYVEMNSLYDYPARKIQVGRHYCGVLIYKIMSRLSNNLRGFLLNLDPELLQILDVDA